MSQALTLMVKPAPIAMTVASENNLSPEERQELAAIFPKQYYELACFEGTKYLCGLMLRFFKNEGILEVLKEKYASCEDLMARCGFLAERKYAFAWILSFLNQEGFLEKQQDSGVKRYHCAKFEDIDLEAMFQKGIARDRGFLGSSDLIQYVLEEYPQFFRGLKSDFEILFAKDKMALWNGYFSNDNSGYKVYNSLGAFGVLKWTEGKDNIKLLEVGGGTAGATCAVLSRLKEARFCGRVGEYIFSDVSPAFLRLGNRAIMEAADEDFNYALKKLDFNRPLCEQGMRAADIDVVYGVNSLHVAKSLVGSLKYIYDVLKPEGLVIFCECCRPAENYLLSQEIIFNLLDTYVNVDLDKDLRPLPGFLDYGHWKKNLESAGFKNIEVLFNTDACYTPDLGFAVNPLAAVIKAER